MLFCVFTLSATFEFILVSVMPLWYDFILKDQGLSLVVCLFHHIQYETHYKTGVLNSPSPVD